MDINSKIEQVFYDNEQNGFPVTYISRGWDWQRLLIANLTIRKYNWKCKACGEKILDDVQIMTHESHRPSYHVLCWQILYQRAIDGIISHNDNLLKQLEGVELTPCQNVIDVQDEQ